MEAGYLARAVLLADIMLLKISCVLLVAGLASCTPVSYVAGPQQPPQQRIALQNPQQALAQAQQQYRLAQQAQAQIQSQAQPQPVYQPQGPGPEQAQQPQYIDPQQLGKQGPSGPPRGQFLPNPEDYDSNPQYQFSFDVKDDQFTNYQNRKESRDGDKISGSYSVVDSDGFIRTVKYTADPLQGFKAEVTREPTDIVVKLPVPQRAYSQLANTPIQDTPSGPGGQPLTHRQQQTQQYLQADPAPHPQSQLFSSLSRPAPQQHKLPNFQAQVAYAPPPSAPQQYQLAAVAPPRPKAVKAGAIGFASQQPGGGNVVYQAYQQ